MHANSGIGQAIYYICNILTIVSKLSLRWWNSLLIIHLRVPAPQCRECCTKGGRRCFAWTWKNEVITPDICGSFKYVKMFRFSEENTAGSFALSSVYALFAVVNSLLYNRIFVICAFASSSLSLMYVLRLKLQCSSSSWRLSWMEVY